MVSAFRVARPLLHLVPPETLHNAGLLALRMNLLPGSGVRRHPALAVNAFGLSFGNCIGLAAGFDKNAVAINGLLKQGFGFVEAGTVTPLAQSGNPKPRIFRLPEDEAVINRLGFNNHGLDPYIRHFRGRDKTLGIAGANIGKNKTSDDAVADYVKGLEAVYPYADYVTVNISSPNTPGLRSLQAKEALEPLLSALANTREKCRTIHDGHVTPILLKIAPDMDAEDLEDVVSLVLAHGIDGMIVSNTTISRPSTLLGAKAGEQGGLSGKPLLDLSTLALKQCYLLSGGKIPLIGVGGVSSARDAYAKIRAGATLVQLYSSLVYQGFGVVNDIQDGLVELLVKDGFSNVMKAVGADTR